MSALTFQQPFYTSNFLLAALPLASLRRLQQHLTYRILHRGDVLHQAGERIERCYFPDRGLVSLSIAGAGGSVGLEMVGREGAVGAANLLSEEPSASQAVVTAEGAGHWVAAEALREVSQSDSAVQNLLLEEVKNSHMRTSQAAVCQLHHTPVERACLVLLRLRCEANSLRFSLPLLTVAGYGQALDTLYRAGFIGLQGEYVTILDADSLEDSVCSCHRNAVEARRRFRKARSDYERQKHEFERLQSLWEGRAWKGTKSRRKADSSDNA